MAQFTVDELDGLEVAYENVSRKGMGKRRWSETFEVVFEYEGGHYRVYVEEGNTEMQEMYGAERYRGPLR
jgi:hypothetical protein